MSPAKPPQIVTQDAGNSESDDHFSSASEGNTEPKSPIPITRVERVDDKPAYGEVPGTPSYNKRIWDAVPDEIEVVPEGQRSRSNTRSRAISNLSLTARSRAASGSPVPRTIVERVDDKPAHGEVEGTAARELRLADAAPDEVKRIEDTNGSAATMSGEDDRQSFFREMWEGKQKGDDEEEELEEEPEAMGDDFDDFAEEGDDFGDFDEADETPLPQPEPQQAELPDVLAGLPELDFSSDETRRKTVDAYLTSIFPDDTTITKPASEIEIQPPSAFLSDRSLSLWQQLVSPPPMQPPNWTRSRIRRLFLVSLGVPVDLDEILPPSKQKRLVLPNINLASSPRASSVIERLRDIPNESTTSIDSKTGAPKPRKTKTIPKGPPPAPEFDIDGAVLICTTADEVLERYDDAELNEHVSTLRSLNTKASSVLEYWLVRKDESLKEKEALEGVIENLVGFVKGRRK